MKIRHILETELPQTIYSFDAWIKLRNSSNYNPEKLIGNFNLSFTRLTNIKGSPKKVDGYFNINDNKITSLEGGPEYVKHAYECKGNQLTSLDGVAKFIGSELDCSYNKITHLKNIHKQINSVTVIDFRDNPLKSNILGLLLIKHIDSAYYPNSQPIEIINKHLDNNRDVLECQEEMIASGFKEYAKL